MSQFNEQIRNRRFQDDCDYIDSLNGIAGAVTGKRMKEAFSEEIGIPFTSVFTCCMSFTYTHFINPFYFF